MNHKDATVNEADSARAREEYYGVLLTYDKGANADSGIESSQREAALYAAARVKGSSEYTMLNNGKAIHYPSSRYAVDPVGTGMMKTPRLFRKPNGSFGLIAGNNNTESTVYLFDSADLITYNNERLLSLNDSGIAVKDPFAKYDDGIGAYRIRWTGSDNRFYESVTDLDQLMSVTQIPSLDIPAVRPDLQVFGPVSEIELTKAEYDRVVNKFSRIKNTGVEPLLPVTAYQGESANLPVKVKTLYSDGTSKYMGVEWDKDDVASIATHKAGTYTVNGTIKQTQYPDPFIKYRADPHITKGSDGYYYFTASYPINGGYDPEGYDRIVLRRSRTLEGLAGTVGLDGQAEHGVHEIVIWDEQNAATNGRNIWAPEIHQIKGKWYVFFTASTSKTDVWAIRPAVIACGGDGDPFKPENWDLEAQFNVPVTGDTMAFNSFSLDMTCFESGGIYYVAWAQYVDSGYSSLLIATIDPEHPWMLTSKSVKLSVPSYAWEKATDGDGMIDEGPAVIKKDGKVYLAFSASSVNWSYCVGVITAQEGADLLDVMNWTKNPYPVLATDDLVNQNGPGHNSFTVDEFGNPVIIYHARTPGEREGSGNGGLGDPGRHARVKPVHFAADGGLVFSMTPEEELNPRYKNVSLTVVVKESNEG